MAKKDWPIHGTGGMLRLIEGESLVMLASTSLPLLSLRLGWSASMLGLYNSAWGVGSGVTPAYCLRVQGAGP